MKGQQLLFACNKYVATLASAFLFAMAIATRDLTLGVVAVVLLLFALGYGALQSALTSRRAWARVTSIALSCLQLFSPLFPLALYSIYEIFKESAREDNRAASAATLAAGQLPQSVLPETRSPAASRARFKAPAIVFATAFTLSLLESLVFGNGLGLRAPRTDAELAQSLRVENDRDNSLQEWREIGARCNSRGDARCSRVAFEQALKYEPRNAQLLANLGIAENRLGHHEAAARLFAVVIDSGNATYDVLAYYGMSLEQLGDLDHALTAYQRSLAIEDSLLDVTQKAASILIRQNKLAQARELLERFTAKHPEASANLRAQLQTIHDRESETTSGVTTPQEI